MNSIHLKDVVVSLEKGETWVVICKFYFLGHSSLPVKEGFDSDDL